MRFDESLCDSMEVDKGRRWFMMVGESSLESMRVYMTR